MELLPYHTDAKNGFGCPELVNLNKRRPYTFLILFLHKQNLKMVQRENVSQTFGTCAYLGLLILVQ